jgi:hypothetical protein
MSLQTLPTQLAKQIIGGIELTTWKHVARSFLPQSILPEVSASLSDKVFFRDNSSLSYACNISSCDRITLTYMFRRQRPI